MTHEQENVQSRGRPIPGVPEHVEQYGLCILFHLLLPLLPLGIELAALGHVEPKTLLLFLAIYPLGIGVSSRSSLMLGFTIVIGIWYSIFFGMSAGSLQLRPEILLIGYLCIIAVIGIHSCERYNRHVIARELFWHFR